MEKTYSTPVYVLLEKHRHLWRRLTVTSVIVLLLHLFFFFFIAPTLKFKSQTPKPVEVISISPKELAKFKEKILNPLMPQEIHKQFRSKERPKDAQMIGPFNQIVPKQKIAGPQIDQPMLGGGQAQSKPKSSTTKLKLSQLGLGQTIPRPLPPQTAELAGPTGPHRPVGRDNKQFERDSENLLNAVENEFYSFFVRLEEPIIRNWFFLIRTHDHKIRGEMASRNTKAGTEFPITIEFVLDQQGNFFSIDIIESSSIPTLDWVTKEAVRKLGSLPNPPPGLFEGGQYFTRRLRFLVYVSESPLVTTRPELYW